MDRPEGDLASRLNPAQPGLPAQLAYSTTTLRVTTQPCTVVKVR